MEEQERDLLICKIKEWQEKSKREIDPFNKYVSIYIAYNIFYNLFEKTENPSATLTTGDKNRSISTINLINDKDGDRIFKLLQSELENYLKIIPIYHEEYWWIDSSKSVPLSKELKQAYQDNNVKLTIDLLLKWLYVVRCNLVHGDKGYNDDKQKELLEKSSLLLNILLQNLLKIYRCSIYT